MKRWMAGIMIICLSLASLTLVSCGDRPITAADGLNLHALATLVRQARDGEHFERLLNTSGINNLDLGMTGKVDYINVTEYGDGDFRGFSLSTTLNDSSVQQIAEIQFQRHMTGITFQIHGNPQIYGPNYYIRSAQALTIGQAAFLGWLFAPRVVYVSPYSRLYLPPAYIPPLVVPVRTYRTVMTPVIKQMPVPVQQVQKPVITSSVLSPNAGKSSPVVVAPLNSPTQTQKVFQERPETKQIQQATGFARKPAASGAGTAGALTPAASSTGTPPPSGALKPPPSQGTRSVAPNISNKSATDKVIQERDPKKEIGAATGFGNKTNTPAQASPPPAPAATTSPAPAPKISGSAPTPAPRMSPSAPSPAPSAPASRPSTPTSSSSGKR